MKEMNSEIVLSVTILQTLQETLIRYETPTRGEVFAKAKQFEI